MQCGARDAGYSNNPGNPEETEGYKMKETR